MSIHYYLLFLLVVSLSIDESHQNLAAYRKRFLAGSSSGVVQPKQVTVLSENIQNVIGRAHTEHPLFHSKDTTQAPDTSKTSNT